MNFEQPEVFLNFRHYGICTDYFEGGAKIEKHGEFYEISSNIECIPISYDYACVLCSDCAAYVDIKLHNTADGILSREQYNPFWSRPSFENDLSKIPDNIQNMLVKSCDGYISILPLCNEDFYAYISPSKSKDTLRISITKFYEGVREINCTWAVVAEDKNPYRAVRKSYEYAVKKGYIISPLRENKRLDNIYGGFGWCSWNACYHEISEKTIIAKLCEFKEKNIPIRWIMLDDGWSQYENDRLVSKFEDKKKFPNGLKGCIDKIKNEYGVAAVGVWHALTGYWYGIQKDSVAYNKNDFLETVSGYYIPYTYKFYNSWYKYLREQGVDFLKIDGQGNVIEFLRGHKNCIKLCRDIQNVAEQSAHENFNDNVINCMGMSNINAYSRKYTYLARTSDDFYPDKPESFKMHLMQNVYNAVFHTNLLYCDFDMWCSQNAAAKASSVLRAISGGPIYVSDKLNESDERYIKPIMDNDGNILKCDMAAQPSPECLFNENDVIKVYNRIGDNAVLALFNTSDRAHRVKISTADICTEGSFVAYAYFAKRFFRPEEEIEISAKDTEIFNFYKVSNGEILLGNTDKYISVASKNKKKININELEWG